MLQRLIYALVISMLLMVPSHAASGHSWKVTKVFGSAWIAAKGVKPRKVSKGSMLNPGETLSTRGRTKLMLSRGKERIQVGSNAVMAIPREKYLKPGKTLILQQAGKLDLAVNKRDVKHFAVKTPYLAAIVKGTKFSVSVNEKKTTVSVRSGKVGVSSSLSGETTDVTAGQTASLDRSKPTASGLSVSGRGKLSKVQKVSKVKAALPAFVTTKTVKGIQKEMVPGSAKKAMSKRQQAKAQKAREVRKAERVNRGFRGSLRSAFNRSNTANGKGNVSNAGNAQTGNSNSGNSANANGANGNSGGNGNGNNGNGNGNGGGNGNGNNGNGNGNGGGNGNGNNGNGNGNGGGNGNGNNGNGNGNGGGNGNGNGNG
jgi:hypothetical protein